MEFSVFDIIAILLGLVALFGYINHKLLKLPHSIGLMVIALAAALALVATELVFPATDVHGPVTAALATIDFDKTLLNGMLSFLLFAGALHVDLSALQRQLVAILAMSTIGVVLSTFTVGVLAWLGFGLIGLDLPFIWALAFGALISPTTEKRSGICQAQARAYGPPPDQATIAQRSRPRMSSSSAMSRG